VRGEVLKEDMTLQWHEVEADIHGGLYPPHRDKQKPTEGERGVHISEQGVVPKYANMEQRLAYHLPHRNERVTREDATANLDTIYPRYAHKPQYPLETDVNEQHRSTNNKGDGEGHEILQYILHRINVLEVAQLTLYEHHKASCVDTSRADQATLTTEHALAQLTIYALILATAHCGVELTEVEVGDVTRRTRCSARATTYAGLQLWHLGNDSPALAQVVVVHVDDTRATDAISEIDVTHGRLLYVKLIFEVGIYGRGS
jgi:hypothetical protein